MPSVMDWKINGDVGRYCDKDLRYIIAWQIKDRLMILHFNFFYNLGLNYCSYKFLLLQKSMSAFSSNYSAFQNVQLRTGEVTDSEVLSFGCSCKGLEFSFQHHIRWLRFTCNCLQVTWYLHWPPWAPTNKWHTYTHAHTQTDIHVHE